MAKEFGIEKVTYKTFDGQEIVLAEKDVRDICGNTNEYLSRSEIELFMKTAMYRKLNPFLGELYLLKNKPYNKDGREINTPAQIIVAKQAVMMIAEENPSYDGLEHGIVVQKSDGTIEDRVGCIKLSGETVIGGWAKVYRKDRRVPFVARLDIKEYSKAKKDGKGTWDTMVCTMIDKCATVSAMRMAFPQQLGGLFTNDEIKNSNFKPTDLDNAADVDDNDENENQNANTEPVVDIPVTIEPQVEPTEIQETIETEQPTEPTPTVIQIVGTKTILGKDYAVYQPNPYTSYQYATKDRFPEFADQYILIDYPEKEGRVAVQKAEALYLTGETND